MSYSFDFNFKEVPNEDLLKVCKEVAATSLKYSEEIIWRNRAKIPSVVEEAVSYSPFFKKIDLCWLYKLFTINFVYWPEKELLGIIGNLSANTMKDVTHVHFQNSFSRSYDYDVWNGINHFEKIISEIRAMEPDEVYKNLNSDHEWYTKEEIAENLEYYKKTLGYDTIYDDLQLNKWLYNEAGDFQVFSFQAFTSPEESIMLKKQITDIRDMYLKI